MSKKTLCAIAIGAALLAIIILQLSPNTPSSGVRVPILMYHHFAETAENDTTVTPSVFEEHISALCDAGYTFVGFAELCDYVENGTPLPEKPICITMDDGYLSNYEIAYPILQKYNACATVFAIGSMLGRDRYPITDYPIIPYFSWNQAKEMQDSSIMNIECHTYDMHQWAPYESGEREVREDVLPLKNESRDCYEAVLSSDLARYVALSETRLSYTPIAFAYPGGKFASEAEDIIKSLGFKATVTTSPHVNYIKKGNPSSLLHLGRFTVTNQDSGKDLLEIIK